VIRKLSTIVVLLTGALLMSACTISSSLTPAMAEEHGRFGVNTEVRQPFYAEHDGVYKLTIRFHPDGFPGSQVPVDPSRGARIELNYAPGDDRRFPEPAFHEWPDDHEWLPELTSEERYEQTFCSPYPDLSGIEVRVATYAADVGTGVARLEQYETVDVLSYPIVGEHVGLVPGGSEIDVAGAIEGWVRVLLGDDEFGYIEMRRFAELPEPHRVNDRDVRLELFEADGDEPIRQSVVNANEMFDISHVQFTFPRVEESLDECFRFEITSPDSEPGNAITLRYDRRGDYQDGGAILNGQTVDGDIVFQPQYDLQEPLYSGYLDDYEWAAPLDAFEARFSPVSNTADRYLEIRVVTGDAPMNVPWSRNRPPGQLPLEVAGDNSLPAGGLIFNASFRHDVDLSSAARAAGRDLYSRGRMDKPFFALFSLALVATAIAGGLFVRGAVARGR
jgi:hypothetical protein